MPQTELRREGRGTPGPESKHRQERGDEKGYSMTERLELAGRERVKPSLQRRNGQLPALQGPSGTPVSSLETREMLEETLSQTVELLGAAGGLIVLSNANSQGLTLAASIGLSGADVAQMDDQWLARIVRRFSWPTRGETVTLDDVGEQPWVGEEIPDQMGFQSSIGAPILHHGQPLGALCIADPSWNAPDETARRLVETIAQQLGVTIGKAQLLEEMARERETARTLLETAETLNTTLRFEHVLERVLNQLHEIVPYDTASVFLLQGDRCQVAASHGVGSSPRGEMSPLIERPHVAEVARKQRPLALSDVGELVSEGMADAIAGLRSWLGVPLVAQDKVVGVLTLSSSHRTIDDEETKQLASTFANQAGLAIENSRLYEQMRSQLREVTILQEVTAAISLTLDLDQVLPYVAHSLCEVLHATSVEIFGLDRSGRVASALASYAAQEAVERERDFEAGWEERLETVPWTAEALNGNHPVQAQMEDPDLHPGAEAELEKRCARALLLLPIVAHDRKLGFVRLWDSGTARRFTQREIATGQTLAHQTAFAMENVHLLEETERRANALAGAANIARHATAILNRRQLLEVVVDRIREQFGFRLASVFLIDDANSELYPAAATEDFWKTLPDGFRQEMGNGVIGKAAEIGETVLITDAGRSDVSIPVEDWLPHSSISVPIQIGGVALGVLEVAADAIAAFDKNDQLALEIIADQIAIAYQNAELLTETRARVKDLQLLHDVSLAAASSSHLQETLQGAAEALATEWPGTGVALQLVDEESGTLRTKASVGYLIDDAEALDLRLGEGITGWVAAHGEPVLAPDVRQDPRYYPANPATRSELCVPLIAGGRPIGTLNVESAKPDAFSVDDQLLLTTLAGNLAILIERARLFEEIEAARGELEQRAQALERANEQLKELDRLKSRFLANVSHELRTPLNSVIGFSEVLIDGLLGEMAPEQRECVENICASGEHLMALINDVLDMSKIEAGHMELAPEPFAVGELIKNAENTVRPMIEEKSQALTLDLAKDLPPLTADRVRVRQVLLNLLSNAQKFTPAEGEITLSCGLADRDTMIFSVTDTGIGIKAEDQEIIFEEFRQANGPAPRDVEGTGLGLAISKRLVEMHDGRIWVESEYGQGTTFSFLLPLTGPMCEEG